MGKTTLIYVFVTAIAKLANQELKVLTVDLDPQGDLTRLLISPEVERYLESINVSGFFENKSPLEKHIFPSKHSNVSLVPSYINLETTKRMIRYDMTWTMRFKRNLDAIKIAYDIVLIDCPSQYDLLTAIGILSADHVIIPITPDQVSVAGYLGTKEMFDSLLYINPDVKFEGLIINMIDKRQSAHQSFLQILEKAGSNMKIFGRMTKRAAIARAVTQCRPVSEELVDADPEFKHEFLYFFNSIVSLAKNDETQNHR